MVRSLTEFDRFTLVVLSHQIQCSSPAGFSDWSRIGRPIFRVRSAGLCAWVEAIPGAMFSPEKLGIDVVLFEAYLRTLSEFPCENL